MKFLTKTIDIEAGSVTFTLGNGDSLTTTIDSLPEHIRRHAILHGLSQKIGDAASGFSKTRDHLGAFHAMAAVDLQLEGGAWNKAGGGTGTTDLAQALANLTGRPIAEVSAQVALWDEDKLKKVKADKRVKAEIKAIQLARAKAAIGDEEETDLGDLF